MLARLWEESLFVSLCLYKREVVGWLCLERRQTSGFKAS